MRQAAADGRQQVVHVVGRVGGDGLEPALLRPDRRLVKADSHHVELAALGGDVGGHALAQRALFQGDPLDLDVGVGLLEEGVSFCISIMWPLLTVAITSSVAAWDTPAAPATARARPAFRKRFMLSPWVSDARLHVEQVAVEWNSVQAASSLLVLASPGPVLFAQTAWDIPNPCNTAWEVACKGPKQTARMERAVVLDAGEKDGTAPGRRRVRP